MNKLINNNKDYTGILKKKLIKMIKCKITISTIKMKIGKNIKIDYSESMTEMYSS